MDSLSRQTPKEKWHGIIRISEAFTEQGKMYYLVDENFDIVPFVKEYLNMIQAKSNREVSPNTIKTYCYLLWYFIVFLKIKQLHILDLDGKPDILVQFKLWLKNPYRFYDNVGVLSYDMDFDYTADELSITTINAIINRVSSLFLWLKASKRIKDNPVVYRNVAFNQTAKDNIMLSHTKRNPTIRANTLKSKTPKIIPKTITEKDFKKFLDSVNLLRDKIILLTLKEGGLRSNELLGLHLEDIDFADQGIWVRFRPDNINGARAKAGYGRDRFVHLPSGLMALIDRYIGTEWLDSNADNDFLFVVVNSNTNTGNGVPMTKSTLDSVFRFHSNKTGIKISPHKLRHTHATELVREYMSKGESVNWEYISKRLGHLSITTTMGMYVHLKTEDYKNEYQRMQKYKEDRRRGNDN